MRKALSKLSKARQEIQTIILQRSNISRLYLEQAQILRELDEKNQTQATVLAERDKVIEQQVTIQHAYRDEMAALKKDLAASRRCGSCRHWDEKAHRCCNSNSQLFSVLSVLRYETCDGWDNLQNLYKQRDGE